MSVSSWISIERFPIIGRIFINEVNSTLPQKNYFSPAVTSLANKILNEYLIISCDQFIAINKPSGIAAQGGSKISLSIDHALQYLNATENSEYRLVHRLDKDTSGVFIIAKNLNSAILLGEAFREKEIKKTYLAVVSGDLSLISKQGTIESYIGKAKSGTHEIIKETKDGKFAKTLYEILASNKNMSAIKYNPLYFQSHKNLADIYFKIHQYDLAYYYYISAIKLNTNYIEAHI